jgi:aryl-alcohol dehydrogenase-like predicted oxidoreductase
MENGMQTVIRGASQLKVTRSRMAPGSSAETGDRWTSRLPAEAVQPPYHLFGLGIEAGLLPYAAAHHIGVLAYGPLARGLPGGTITFGPGDWRSHTPAFTAAPPSPSSRWPGRWPTRPCGSPSSARTPHHLQERVGASIWR